MAKRLEKYTLDQIFSKGLLGKRKLGLPLKHNYEKVRMDKAGRFKDMLYFPRSKLEKTIGNIYERCMPGFKYLFWDETVYWARFYGYTLQEKLYHSWMRAPQVLHHAMAQSIHPWGWLQNQKRDAFIRRMNTLIPGIQAPDWAQETRRAHDMDINSVDVPQEAMKDILRESTPFPYGGRAIVFNIYNFFNNKFNFGLPAQRLFFNEDLRGDFYNSGYITEKDKKIIHGWYANAQGSSQRDRINNLNDEEREFFEENRKRWNKNFNEFYPELSTKVHNPVLHKYEEQYYERNMFDIRTSIFTKKWTEAMDKFSAEEIQQIHEFFLNENTEVFFVIKPNEVAKASPLYCKFIEELDFPNFFEIDRFTTYTPEKQFYDLMDRNWGINFDTVDAYRNLYISYIKNDPNTDATDLIKEEVYNPLFRKMLINHFQYGLSQDDSYVVKALEKGENKEEINNIAKAARENVIFSNVEVLKNMVNTQVRRVIATINWDLNV